MDGKGGAGEISAHQRQARWPAYCCFKAPINFPPVSVNRWGETTSNAISRHQRVETSEAYDIAIFRKLQHTTDDYKSIPALLQCAIGCHLANGGSFLRCLACHSGHVVMLYIQRSKVMQDALTTHPFLWVGTLLTFSCLLCYYFCLMQPLINIWTGKYNMFSCLKYEICLMNRVVPDSN